MLYAGAAIGVSHLIQSTRAGADYGWLPVIAIIGIHLVKYPFFKAGSAYAVSAKESLISGYKRIGNWALLLYFLITVATMFTVIAAITAVSVGLIAYVFQINLSPALLTLSYLVFSVAFLLFGRYTWLEKIMSGVILVLTISTILAFTSAWFDPPAWNQLADSPVLDGVFLMMLIKLMGWMPAPLDLSVWHSIWTEEKMAIAGGYYDQKAADRDFKIGYWGTMVVGVLFLGLGALVLHGHPESLPDSGVKFSHRLISVYTTQLGDWAFWIVGVAALTTMISTTLTCLDAIPRSLNELWHVWKPDQKKSIYGISIRVLALGSFAILYLWGPAMVTMVDIATLLSFCTSPIFAFLNYRAMNLDSLPADQRWTKGENYYALTSITILSVLAVAFLILRFGW